MDQKAKCPKCGYKKVVTHPNCGYYPSAGLFCPKCKTKTPLLAPSGLVGVLPGFEELYPEWFTEE